MQQTFEATIDILFNPIQATILSQEIPKVFFTCEHSFKDNFTHSEVSLYLYRIITYQHACSIRNNYV